MTTDILQAVAMVLEQMDNGTFKTIMEATQMTLEECIKQSIPINMDTSHPYIMTCTPFVGNVVAS